MELVPHSSALPADTERARMGAALVAAFLAGRTERTLRAYRQDLESFRTFLHLESIDQVATALLSRTLGEANGLVLEYRTHLTSSGLAPATTNRRLAAVRSMVTLGRTLGMVSWSLEVPGVRARKYRDTRGPGLDGFARMLEACRGRARKARRDRALLWMLFGLALRRNELVELDLADVERDRGTPSGVWICGKGHTEKELLSLPARVGEALEDWLQARGELPGPLFCNVDRAAKGAGALTGSGVYAIVRTIANKAGMRKVRPHGLRHAAITAALDAGEDVRRVRRFSRHARLDTVLIYDDNRDDVAGDVASKVTQRVRKAS